MQAEYGSPTGAPQPEGGRAPARRFNPWVVMLVLSLGMFMTLLDLTIVNIAIPRIVDGVHASLDEVLWMLNAYSLGYAVLLITSGRLGDIVGPRRLFMGGIALFTAASALSGLAPSASLLIVGRVLQGIGAALLAPQSMAILLSIFPPERRGPVFGVFGMLSGLAVVAGPTLGGVLVTDLSWRWIFFVNLPIGLGVLLAASRLVPDLRPGRRHRLDLAGVALVTAAIFAIVFGLIEGQRYDWGTITGPISIPLIIAAGVVLLGAFLVHQARRQGGEPLLSFALFRDRNFTLMALVLAAMSFFILGIYLPLTIYYQSVLGLSAIAAGLVVAVQPGAMFLSTGPANGPASARLGANRVLTLGLLLLAAGAAYIAWDVHAGLEPVVGGARAGGGRAGHGLHLGTRVPAGHPRPPGGARRGGLGNAQHGPGDGRGDRQRGGGSPAPEPPRHRAPRAGGRRGGPPPRPGRDPLRGRLQQRRRQRPADRRRSERGRDQRPGGHPAEPGGDPPVPGPQRLHPGFRQRDEADDAPPHRRAGARRGGLPPCSRAPPGRPCRANRDCDGGQGHDRGRDVGRDRDRCRHRRHVRQPSSH